MTKQERIEALRNKGNVAVRDLADLVGVDPSTVSRALNRDPRISTERGRQIRRLAKEVGYRPRPLRARKARAVGLVIATTCLDRPDAQYLERIAWLTQRVVREHDFHVHFECVLRNPESGSLQIPAVIQENRVDGVLLSGHPPVALVDELRESGLPLVAINDSVERLGISCVRTDPSQAIHEAVLRLAAWGHERFALLVSDLEYPAVAARYQSYRDSLEEIGLPLDERRIVKNLPEGIPGGYAGVKKLLELDQLPTAIICCNDWMALGALQKLQQIGLKVPDDVSLVGHDDVPFCQEVEPTLTSCARSELDMVSGAMEMLLEEMAAPSLAPRQKFVESSIVWRESTGLTPERRVAAGVGA